jgi:hypothetical protein
MSQPVYALALPAIVQQLEPYHEALQMLPAHPLVAPLLHLAA